MKTIPKIESYLNGSMDPEERLSFSKEMSEDPNLKEEVSLHNDINTAIKENDIHHFRATVNDYLNRKSTVYHKFKQPWIKYAVVAVFILLATISLKQFLFVNSPEKLFNSFYKPYEAYPSTRSSINGHQENKDMDIGYQLYEKREYKASFKVLQKYLADNKDDVKARFYYGMDALELGFYETAINELTTVDQIGSNPLSIHSRWYLALIYLKTSQPENARKYLLILTSDNNIYSVEAEKILDKL